MKLEARKLEPKLEAGSGAEVASSFTSSFKLHFQLPPSSFGSDFRLQTSDLLRYRALLAAALYALFLLTAPFEHHDLLCHIKTPQHCTSCSSSLLGSDPHAPAILTHELRDAGRAMARLSLPESVLFAVRSSGRSPPAALDLFL